MKRIKISIFLMALIALCIVIHDFVLAGKGYFRFIDILGTLKRGQYPPPFIWEKRQPHQQQQQAETSTYPSEVDLNKIKELMNDPSLAEATRRTLADYYDRYRSQYEDVRSTKCDGNVFYLEVLLESKSTGLSWELKNENTNTIVGYHHFDDDDDSGKMVEIQTFQFCIEKGPHVFTFLDATNNNMICSEGKECYNVYIDDELIIQEYAIKNEIAVHYFDTTSFCVVGSVFMLKLQLDSSNTSYRWYLQEYESEEFIDLWPISSNSKSQKNATQTYYVCLATGKYDFNLYDTNDGNVVSCKTQKECYEMENELFHFRETYINEKF